MRRKKTSESSPVNVQKNNQTELLLIGIGNPYRSDDGVGLLVAQKIRESKLPSVTVKEESGDGVSLMEAWRGYQNIIIVDAVSSGAVPGTIFKIDVRNEEIPPKLFFHSTHTFSVAEAIELAKVMHTLPPNLIIYGIEGASFTAGVSISSRVKATAKKVSERIFKDIQCSGRKKKPRIFPAK